MLSIRPRHTVEKIARRRLAYKANMSLFAISGRNVFKILYKINLLNEQNTKDNDFVQKSQNMTD